MVVIVLLLGGVGLVGFWVTGGRGLVRIIPNYLMADIPDKRYGWSDFRVSVDTNKISGFYSPQLSGDSAVAIWTMSGLKRFYHEPGTSVYYHRDACAIVNAIKNGGENVDVRSLEENLNTYYFDIAQWQDEMKSEYLVTMQWVEEDGRRVVDKLWSVSGRYKVLGQLGGLVCD